MIPLNIISSLTSIPTPKTLMLCETVSTIPLSSIQYRDRSTFDSHPSHPRLAFGCSFLNLSCHWLFCSAHIELRELDFNNYSLIQLVWKSADLSGSVDTLKSAGLYINPEYLVHCRHTSLYVIKVDV